MRGGGMLGSTVHQRKCCRDIFIVQTVECVSESAVRQSESKINSQQRGNYGQSEGLGRGRGDGARGVWRHGEQFPRGGSGVCPDRRSRPRWFVIVRLRYLQI